jgi:hypothetical protein
MRNSEPRLLGTLARPIGEVELEEEETNGLDEVVRWDDLERGLDRGAFAFRTDVKREVGRQFAEAERPFYDSIYREVLDGLFPEYRAMYDALPMGTSSSVFVGKLNAETVREIRTRHAAGEMGSRLAEEFGVRPNTISDLLNNKTWRNVA